LTNKKITVLEPNLSGNERRYVNQCIDDNWISSQGTFVKSFEVSMARQTGRSALSTCNGTVAIHLALTALGVKSKDEVIVPNLTFGATVNAVLHAGAVPVIVDVDVRDWNICRQTLDSALTPATKAIIPVALFGSPSGLAEVVKWAEENGIYCVIDAAEAVGSTINGFDIGGFGDAITYSYFANKTITSGEGGGVVFKEESIFEHAKVLRDHGMKPNKRYHHEYVGFNYRLTNIQAAIGVAQYERLDEILMKKNEILNHYKKHLISEDIKFQYLGADVVSSNWVVAIKVPYRLRIKIEHELRSNNIEFRPCFETMSSQPAFKDARCVGLLENSKRLSKEIIMLPSHFNLKMEDVERVASAVLAGIS
jgi:perosamine synthetase